MCIKKLKLKATHAELRRIAKWCVFRLFSGNIYKRLWPLWISWESNRHTKTTEVKKEGHQLKQEKINQYQTTSSTLKGPFWIFDNLFVIRLYSSSSHALSFSAIFLQVILFKETLKDMRKTVQLTQIMLWKCPQRNYFENNELILFRDFVSSVFSYSNSKCFYFFFF